MYRFGSSWNVGASKGFHRKLNMKKLLILLLLPLISQAQLVINGDTLATRDWVRKQIGTGSVAPCSSGPTIKTIYDIKSNAITVNWYGVGVTEIGWKITNEAGGKLYRSGIFEPTNDRSTISFDLLQPGTYLLTFSGTKCIGSSNKTFEVKGETTIPPIEGPGEPTDWKVVNITKGYSELLDVAITGTSGNWVINDNSTITPPDGFEFRYGIGADTLPRKTALKNYAYQSNAPLRIWKAIMKPGVEWNKWDRIGNCAANPKDCWYDVTGGRQFDSPSQSHHVEFSTWVFIGPKSQDGFIDPVVSGYDPTLQRTQWPDIAPDMSLPKGKFLHLPRGDISTDILFKKGVTHISNYEMGDLSNSQVMALQDAGKTYSGVPRTDVILGLSRNGSGWSPSIPLSRENAIKAGERTSISDALDISETEERDPYIAPGDGMWGNFYPTKMSRLNARFGARGIPFLVGHNYFNFEEQGYDGTSEHVRKIFANGIPQSNFSPGGSLSATSLRVTAGYLGTPDAQNDVLNSSILKSYVMAKLNKSWGIFFFGRHEEHIFGIYEYKYPDGRYMYYDKMPVDPSVTIAHAFISMVYGSVFVEWGGEGKSTSRKWKNDPEWANNNGKWIPNGSDRPQGNFPHFAGAGEKTYGGYTGSSDLAYFGIKLYNDTFGQTDGGETAFLTFRIDGGKWITPDPVPAMNSVLARDQKRGFVYSQSKVGKIAYFYMNSYADNKKHKLEVQLPNGITVTETVSTHAIHAKLL